MVCGGADGGDGGDVCGDDGDGEEEPQSRTKKRRISRAERVATASALAVGGDFIMVLLCEKLKRVEAGILCAVDMTYSF